MKQRPDLAALAFCALVVIAVVVLSALHAPVPDFLPAVGMFVAGVGGGSALNNSPATSSLGPAPAAIPAAPVPAPRPASPYVDPSQTGTFARIAGDH